ncbi:class III lanthionine synthetase LanKC [Staphylococcus ureilyticus]|uniref:class III lanthionine synthetase LanKC n=1 Tax=Staphylococcus ureilyticus TaxID=94138 RepID=UPI0032194F1B
MERDNLLYNYYMSPDSKFFKKAKINAENSSYMLNEVPSTYTINSNSESVWTFYYIKEYTIPNQGWKIHISSSLRDTTEILKTVSEICFKNNLPFKHLKDFESYMKLNSKNAHRSASGKFITIYPYDQENFLKLLDILHNELSTFAKGPYILSDKRWKNGNVFYRYGAFKSMFDNDGNLCIYTPEGKLVKDNRTPFYNPPEFVKNFDQYLDTINITPSNNNNNLSKYNIKYPFTFSNAGGVYFAERKRDSKRVVIKEARPQSGLDGSLKDALYRQEKEYNALSDLTEVPGVVNIVEYFKEWEHYFLVEEYIEGIDLKKWTLINYPFYKNKGGVKHYAEQVISISKQIVKLIEEIHRKKISMVDMQPANLLVDENLNVTLIDFETASGIKSSETPSLKTVGFISDKLKINGSRDWYGVKKIIQYMFLPVLNSEMLDNDLNKNHMRWIKDNYGGYFFDLFVKFQKYCDKKIQEYESVNHSYKYDVENNIYNIHTIKTKLLEGLIDNLTDDSRFINGDIRQFEFNNGEFNFINGGAGAAFTIIQNEENRKLNEKWIKTYCLPFIEVCEDWGLMTGKCGVLSMLYENGYKSYVEEKVESLFENFPNVNIYMRSGLSGIGIFLISIFQETQNSEYLEILKKIAEDIKNKIDANQISIETNDWMAVDRGLIDGLSGVSLFYSLLYAIIPQKKYIDMAKTLIDKEIENSEEEMETLQLKDDRNRLLPYLSGGSIGLGIAIYIFNLVTNKSEYSEIVKKIANISNTRSTISGGLFDGAGSFLLIPIISKDKNDLDKVVELLHLFLIREGKKLRYPGQFSYRLSDDVYSGSSGIILAINALENDNPLNILPLINSNNLLANIKRR